MLANECLPNAIPSLLFVPHQYQSVELTDAEQKKSLRNAHDHRPKPNSLRPRIRCTLYTARAAFCKGPVLPRDPDHLYSELMRRTVRAEVVSRPALDQASGTQWFSSGPRRSLCKQILGFISEYPSYEGRRITPRPNPISTSRPRMSLRIL